MLPMVPAAVAAPNVLPASALTVGCDLGNSGRGRGGAWVEVMDVISFGKSVPEGGANLYTIQ